MKKFFRRFFLLLLMALALAVVLLIVGNLVVILSTQELVYSGDQLSNISESDCILVLGASVKQGGILSNALEQRVKTAILLYNDGASSAILMSGDGKEPESYCEPDAMKQYAMEHGVDESSILCDNLGLSTYESLLRTRDVYGMKKVIIVTQKYHLYRSIYYAKALGLEVVGAVCDEQPLYAKNYIREVFARPVAMIQMLFTKGVTTK